MIVLAGDEQFGSCGQGDGAPWMGHPVRPHCGEVAHRSSPRSPPRLTACR